MVIGVPMDPFRTTNRAAEWSSEAYKHRGIALHTSHMPSVVPRFELLHEPASPVTYTKIRGRALVGRGDGGIPSVSVAQYGRGKWPSEHMVTGLTIGTG